LKKNKTHTHGEYFEKKLNVFQDWVKKKHLELLFPSFSNTEKSTPK
jgi:hypothetical protein